jgi:hypothetical protein
MAVHTIVENARTQDNIFTYQIGIDISKLNTGGMQDGNPDNIVPYDKMNEIALLGGKPKDDPTEKFYAANNEIELKEALELIAKDALRGRDPIPFMPGRVVLQDFTGVPAVVDLAAMRERHEADGRRPRKVNPLVPCDLVIDHSVQVDAFGTPDALQSTASLEFERNLERYEFLKWGQQAFDNFRVVPPATGIVHQVNLEYLAKVVWEGEERTEGPLPRLARRHRLPHHHDQRPRRRRLGRRRHRGRGGHARPAHLHAHPRGRRLQAHRQAARGRHRHRPRPPRHPDAAQARRRRQVRRVLRPRPGPHAARQPRHHRQHGAPSTAPPSASSPSTSRPSSTCASPAATRNSSRTVEAYYKLQGLWRDDSRRINYSASSSSTSAPSSPPSPAPSAPRTASPSPRCRRAGAKNCPRSPSAPKRWAAPPGSAGSGPGGSRPRRLLRPRQPPRSRRSPPRVAVTSDGASFEIGDGRWSSPPSPVAPTPRTPRAGRRRPSSRARPAPSA